MRYYLLIPNVEAEWRAKTAEERDALFAVHEKFAALLATVESAIEIRAAG